MVPAYYAEQGLCNGQASTRPSVCLIGRRVFCWAPYEQDISIDSCRRLVAGAGAQQQIRATSDCDCCSVLKKRFNSLSLHFEELFLFDTIYKVVVCQCMQIFHVDDTHDATDKSTMKFLHNIMLSTNALCRMCREYAETSCKDGDLLQKYSFLFS